MEKRELFRKYKATIIKQKKLERLTGVIVGGALGSQTWAAIILIIPVILYLKQTEKFTDEVELGVMEED